MYTGCRPAELADAQKVAMNDNRTEKAANIQQKENDNNWDSRYKSIDEPRDDDPVYNDPDPWSNPNNTDYNNTSIDNAKKLIQEYKALCYKDI
jgi:hypothetical protein